MEHSYPTVSLFGIEGLTVNLTVVGMSLLAAILVAVIVMAAVRGADVRRPGKLQTFFEMIVDFVRGLASDTVGQKRADAWVPFALTLFIWMFVANQLGLITNITAEAGDAQGHAVSYSFFMSPTADFTVAMTMGISMVLLSHIVGLRHPGQYFKHWVTPLWMFPLHLIEELPKFLTLGLRLFGNIFAGEVMIGILLGMTHTLGVVTGGLAAGVPLLVWIGYSLMVGTIQAFVFTVLTLVYIGQKMPHEEHH
ncbi:F0F1 ATP synthase subunit A [Effusibacillus dendaii]|uniref:ATP synthase subunit a n=1 Tax=Effusibacillus dendaii TaxID=2743772 RepID=A0A7I8DFJ3_9BACL|nr:F0F1 ATP synthase subunit A [Effusibacillus dendaii]BCJ87719.1 ATP synthase subunit a [Effusibacillus dendaii]